ncbi:MAG: hypothetical protein AAGF95_17925 [Chloroflexota bacterium]
MDDERSHIKNLINAHRKRLRVLEIQAAQYGIDARPEILIELEEIPLKIQKLEQELWNLEPQQTSNPHQIHKNDNTTIESGAFARRIQKRPAGRMGQTHKPQASLELGNIVESVTVQLDDVLYQIERYQNSSIKVLNTNTQEYVTALPILRQINSEKVLGINLFWPNSREKNTRTLGREVMRALWAQD